MVNGFSMLGDSGVEVMEGFTHNVLKEESKQDWKEQEFSLDTDCNLEIVSYLVVEED